MKWEEIRRKTEDFLRRGAEQIGGKVGSLVGAEIGVRVASAGPVAREDLCAKLRKKAAVILLEGSDGGGHLLVCVRLQEAILLSATLQMIPAAQVKELVRAGELSQDLADAFNEVANIVYGALDDLVLEISSQKEKLRSEGIQLVDAAGQNGLAPLWPEGETFGVEITLALQGYEPGIAYLVLDDVMIAKILGVALEPKGASDVAPDPGTPFVILCGGASADDGEIGRFFAAKGIAVRRAESAEAAVSMLPERPLAVLTEVSYDRNREVLRVCRAAEERESRIPVVGVIDNPTRETILSGRKAGVRAFLVHPFSAETLRGKLEPLLS